MEKFKLFKEQAAFLRTASQPPILYLPTILTRQEQDIIDDQLQDAKTLVENCERALRVT